MWKKLLHNDVIILNISKIMSLLIRNHKFNIQKSCIMQFIKSIVHDLMITQDQHNFNTNSTQDQHKFNTNLTNLAKITNFLPELSTQIEHKFNTNLSMSGSCCLIIKYQIYSDHTSHHTTIILSNNTHFALFS